MDSYFYHLYVCLLFTTSLAVFSSQEKRSLLFFQLQNSPCKGPCPDSYSPPKPGTKFDTKDRQEAETYFSPKQQSIVESKSHSTLNANNNCVSTETLDARANDQEHNRAMEDLTKKSRSESIPIDCKNINQKWYAYYKLTVNSNK